MEDELGLLRDYGNWIMGAVLIGYGILYTILCKDYGPIDEQQ